MILSQARHIGFQGKQATSKSLPVPGFRRSRGEVQHVAVLAAEGSELVFTYDTQVERTGIPALLADLSRAGILFRDLHTTILYQLGLDQDALSYMHLGRKERLTEVRGEIVKGIIA